MHGEEADREPRSLPPGDPQRVLHAQRAQGLRDTLQGTVASYVPAMERPDAVLRIHEILIRIRIRADP
jgi:hypothetical protein